MCRYYQVTLTGVDMFKRLVGYFLCPQLLPPNFEEVEGAYWFGSVHAVSAVVCSMSVCLSVMRE